MFKNYLFKLHVNPYTVIGLLHLEEEFKDGKTQ